MAGPKENPARNQPSVDNEADRKKLGHSFFSTLRDAPLFFTPVWEKDSLATPMINSRFRLALSYLELGLKKAQKDPLAFPLPPDSASVIGEKLGEFAHGFHNETVNSKNLLDVQLDIKDADNMEERFLFPLAVVVEKDPDNNLTKLLMSYVAARGGVEVATSPQKMRREYKVIMDRFKKFRGVSASSQPEFSFPHSDRPPLFLPDDKTL